MLFILLLYEVIYRNYNTIKTKANHLERFTSGYQYASALWIMCKHLSSKYPLDVREWLELLLGQKHFYQKKRGLWYSHLSMVYKAHLKENGKVCISKCSSL